MYRNDTYSKIQDDKFFDSVFDQVSDQIFLQYKTKSKELANLCNQGNVRSAKDAFKALKHEVKQGDLYAQHAILQHEARRLKLESDNRDHRDAKEKLTANLKLRQLGENYSLEKLKSNIQNNPCSLTLANLGLSYEAKYWQKLLQTSQFYTLAKTCFFLAYILAEDKKSVFCQEMLKKIKKSSFYILFNPIEPTNLLHYISGDCNNLLNDLNLNPTVVSHIVKNINEMIQDKKIDFIVAEQQRLLLAEKAEFERKQVKIKQASEANKSSEIPADQTIPAPPPLSQNINQSTQYNDNNNSRYGMFARRTQNQLTDAHSSESEELNKDIALLKRLVAEKKNLIKATKESITILEKRINQKQQKLLSINQSIPKPF